MMTRVLVTGSGGQLGRALREAERRRTGERTGEQAADSADRNESAEFDWLFVDGAGLDVADKDAVELFFRRERPDVVVNCAAFTDVDASETEREAAFRVNRDAPHFLAEAAAGHGVSLIHISTDFVFDGRQRPQRIMGECYRPYKEDDTPAPLNVYGESKLAGERAVLETGCAGVVVRTSWLYSPWGRNFVRSILGAAAKNAEIRVVSDQRGCPTSAVSLAGAIARMLPKLIARPRRAEIYNYCDAGVVSRAEFAEEIVKQAGLDCRVVSVASEEYHSKALRPAYSALDTSKITLDFGIVPPPWQEALAGCIKTIKNGC